MSSRVTVTYDCERDIPFLRFRLTSTSSISAIGMLRNCLMWIVRSPRAFVWLAGVAFLRQRKKQLHVFTHLNYGHPLIYEGLAEARSANEAASTEKSGDPLRIAPKDGETLLPSDNEVSAFHQDKQNHWPPFTGVIAGREENHERILRSPSLGSDNLNSAASRRS